jgi:hypothetical protein
MGKTSPNPSESKKTVNRRANKCIKQEWFRTLKGTRKAQKKEGLMNYATTSIVFYKTEEKLC